jgi:hypothetical protein
MFIRLFKHNHEILHMQVKDITQTESMLQLPFEGNCLNWVVGHILDTYNICLGWLDQPILWNEADTRVYAHGSDPLTDPNRALELSEMLSKLDTGIVQITIRLASLATIELERVIDYWFGKVTLIEALFFMHWHASYHTGQLEQLRQLANKHDKVL